MLTTVLRQANLEFLSFDKLQDGSTTIMDGRSKSVHSLNPSASLIWETCAHGATTDQIRVAITGKFGPVAEDAVRHAVTQLIQAKLIESESPLPAEIVNLGRRSLLKRVGAAAAVAIPVVLTLTASEQKAYALFARSVAM